MKKSGGRATTVGVGGAITVSVVVLVVLWFFTFGGGNTGDVHSDTLRVGYFPVVGHAIPIIGVEQGIFEQHLPDTVRLEARVFDSGPQVVESMFADSIDIAYAGPGPAINAFLNSEKGNKIRILSTAASGGSSFVIHPKFESDNFEFAHKRIAAPQIGNTQDVSLRNHLHGMGLKSADRGGNVIIYNIPNPDIVTLFVKGEIDGAWVSEPWATILVDAHEGKRLFYEEDLWPDGSFATVLLIANMQYVRDNPDIIDSWMTAHDKVAKVINSDKDAAGMGFNDFLSKHFGQKLDPSTAQTAMYNTQVTTEPMTATVYEFADRADRLGYMGRGGYDLSGLYYYNDDGYGHILGDDAKNGTNDDAGGDYAGNDADADVVLQ